VSAYLRGVSSEAAANPDGLPTLKAVIAVAEPACQFLNRSACSVLTVIHETYTRPSPASVAQVCSPGAALLLKYNGAADPAHLRRETKIGAGSLGCGTGENPLDSVTERNITGAGLGATCASTGNR